MNVVLKQFYFKSIINKYKTSQFSRVQLINGALSAGPGLGFPDNERTGSVAPGRLLGLVKEGEL
jgi:hypothetical protein